MPELLNFKPASGAHSGSYGSLASGLLRCGSVNEFRAAAPLPKDAQELIDRAVINVGLDRLVLAADIMAAGLTYPLANWLSVMELYWEKEGKIGHAQRTMQPGARGESQLPKRSGARIPIYATIDDFRLGIRTLLASERAGAPLDTSMVAQATRRVNEAIEDSFLNGGGITVDGNTAPGVLNEANVNTYNFVDNEAWTAAGHSGEDILTDVLQMILAAHNDRKFGPYNLYIPTAYGVEIDKDFKSATSGTTRQRLEALQAGGRPLVIRVADQMPTNTVALIQMTNDVVEAVVGQEPTSVSWSDGPGWELNTAVMACVVPRVRSDYDGNSGIVVGTPS